MPATTSQPLARERYLEAVDELVARLGRDGALHFMRQATNAVDGKPSNSTVRRMREFTVRQRSVMFAEALELAQAQ